MKIAALTFLICLILQPFASAQTKENDSVLKLSVTYDLAHIENKWARLEISPNNERILVRTSKGSEVHKLNEFDNSVDLECSFTSRDTFASCKLDVFSPREVRRGDITWNDSGTGLWIVETVNRFKPDRRIDVVFDNGSRRQVVLSLPQKSGRKVLLSRCGEWAALIDNERAQSGIQNFEGSHVTVRTIDLIDRTVGPAVSVSRDLPIFGAARPRVTLWEPRLGCDRSFWFSGEGDWGHKIDRRRRTGKRLTLHITPQGSAEFLDLDSGDYDEFDVNSKESRVLVTRSPGQVCADKLVVSHGRCRDVRAQKDALVAWYYDLSAGKVLWERRQDVGNNIRSVDPIILPDHLHALVVLPPTEFSTEHWRDVGKQTLEVIRLSDGETVQSIILPTYISDIQTTRDKKHIVVMAGSDRLLFFDINSDLSN